MKYGMDVRREGIEVGELIVVCGDDDMVDGVEDREWVGDGKEGLERVYVVLDDSMV